jgi:hypothetical protein
MTRAPNTQAKIRLAKGAQVKGAQVKIRTNHKPTPCQNSARAFFHERIGQYFETQVDPDTYTGECAICGATIASASKDSLGNPQCAEQRVLAQKRHRPAAGQPIAFGMAADKPEERGHCAIAQDGAIALATSGLSFFAANAIPTKPLPDYLTAEAVRKGQRALFWRRFLENPPEPPFLLVFFGKKSTAPLAITQTLARVMVCGDSAPVAVDIPAIQKLLPLADRMGISDFKAACAARAAIARGRTDQKLLKEVDKLRLRHHITVPEFRTLPEPGSIEAALVSYGGSHSQEEDA